MPCRQVAVTIGLGWFLLIEVKYVVSVKLRKWCEENRNRCYIPEWLLDEWGFRVNADLSGAA